MERIPHSIPACVHLSLTHPTRVNVINGWPFMCYRSYIDKISYMCYRSYMYIEKISDHDETSTTICKVSVIRSKRFNVEKSELPMLFCFKCASSFLEEVPTL